MRSSNNKVFLLVVTIFVVWSFWFFAVTFTEAQGPISGNTDTGLVGVPQNSPDQNADSNQSKTPSQPNIAFSYYHVSGSALQPRDSSTTYSYDGSGCMHRTAGSTSFTRDIHIPSGSTLKFIRIYYRNTVAGNAGSGFITYHDDGSGTTDLVSATSDSTAGVNTVLSAEITHTVDNSSFAYVVIWLSPASVNQLCGLRIAYYAVGGFTFLPAITK